MNEYRIKIGGLDCPNCTAKLERGIKNNKNFIDVSLSFVNKLLILKSELSLEEVKHELNKIINKVEPDAYIDEDDNKYHEHEHHNHEHKDCCCPYEHHHGEECECHHEHHHEHKDCCSYEHHEHKHSHKNDNKKLEIILMAVSIIILIIGLLLNKFIIISTILFILSYLVISYDILFKAFKNIIRGQIFDENFLMAIASIGALFLKEYHEAILVIFLYKLGELFQDYALNNSHKSIK